LRDVPIPWTTDPEYVANCRQIPFNFDHLLANEPLIDVAQYGLAYSSFYSHTDGLNAPYHKSFVAASDHIWLRQSAAGKLIEVNEILAPYNVEVLLLDGYRSIAMQTELWNHFINQAKLSLREPSEDECLQFAKLYCADPRQFDENDWRTWPSHSTGGAVDLTLRSTATKELLFFGGIFDDASPISFTDHFEKSPDVSKSASTREALRNRRLLYWSMISVGFSNYPVEWWHYDFGNQMWCGFGKNRGRDESMAADEPFYGYAKPPS
jgi:D-alanyl-D-alanine dipeptidase